MAGYLPYVTLGEAKQIDWILNGQATVEHPEAWLRQQVEHIIRMWTAPSASRSGTLLMMQVRSQPITRNRSISAGNMEADAWGKTSDGGSAKAQESSVGAYDQVEWPE